MAAAGLAAAGVLLDPLGAPADGAARLQPAVSLVRGARRGRCGVGPLDVLQEPRPAAGGGCGGEVPGGRAAPPQGEAVPVGRALLGRRHAGGGLGQPEELPRQGRLRRAAGCPAGGGQRGAATASATSTARSAATRRTPPPPTPRPSSTRRAKARRPSSATWGMR